MSSDRETDYLVVTIVRHERFCLIAHLRREDGQLAEMKQLRLFDMSLIVEIFQLRLQISNCLRTARYADVFRCLGAAEQRLFNLTDALNFRPDEKKMQSQSAYIFNAGFMYSCSLAKFVSSVTRLLI